MDVVLDALTIRLTEGYEAAAPLLTRALDLVLAEDMGGDEAGAGEGLEVLGGLWLP